MASAKLVDREIFWGTCRAITAGKYEGQTTASDDICHWPDPFATHINI
jgi:hypothetical protein